MAKHRNVLLIVADQWRGDSLGVLGHPSALTPNLDALARDGVTFRSHFGQSAPCGPARASLLTGLYVMNHRVAANGVPQAFNPGRTLVGVGLGTWGSQAALSVGASHIFNEGQVAVKITGSFDTHGSAGSSEPSFCSSSIEMLSGVRTNAMWPSRGGRLIGTPAFISR